MKATAKKSSTSSATATRAASQPFFAKAGGGSFFAPANGATASVIQMKMAVAKPGDKFEQEADRMADKVMRMPTPPSSVKEEKLQRQPEDKLQKKEEEQIQKAAMPEEKIQKAAIPEEKIQKKEGEEIQKASMPEEKLQKKEEEQIQKAAMPEEKIQKAAIPEEKVQKKEDEEIQKVSMPEEKLQKKEEEKLQKSAANEDQLQRKGEDSIPLVDASIQLAIQNKTAGGQPLSADVRHDMEMRFGADFSNVRIHNDSESAVLSNQLGARAFTYRNHIFFARGQYQPGTSQGKLLLAHELTHTIQQGAAVQGDAVHRSNAVTQIHSQRDRLHRQGENSSWFDRISQAIGNAVEFGENVGWRLLEEFVPELVPIVRQGPVEWFKEKISNAVESVFDNLMAPVRSLGRFAPSLVEHFENLMAWIQDAAARLASGDCGAVTEAAENIQQVFEGLATPIIDGIKHLSDQVKDYFNGLWDSFGAPAWQFLQQIGGAAWERIQQLGQWVWEKTEPIRDVMRPAWTWIKNKLGIGEETEGQDGILQWLQRKAESVWEEHIKPFYERYRQPILIIIGIWVMLSPAGPIIAIGAAIGGLAAGIRWITQNLRERDAVVQQRDMLQGVIIPSILNAVNHASAFLMEKAHFVSGKLMEVVSGLNQALGIAAGSILRFAVGIMQWLIDRFQELVIWAIQGLMGLVVWVTNTLERLRAFLQPILDVLGEIAQVARDIMRLPTLLAGRLWNFIPACIRDPFVDFFIPLILRQIAFFRELAASPEAWRETRTQVMDLIHQVFSDFDLLGAIRSAFNLVVRALRIPIELMGELLEKAADAWDAVIAAPLSFIENALKSILQGMGRFVDNILSHLGFGVQGWLLNAVSGSGISPPASWADPRAVFGFVLDVMGISIDHVIELINRRHPGAGRLLRGAMSLLTGALEWLQIAIDEGPRGLWNHLVDHLSDLGTAVLESAVSWVMTRVIARVSVRITALAASAGLTSVLEAVKAVYSAIQTAIEFMPRILAILVQAFDTVAQIAAGVIAPAAERLENGLRMAMPVAIGFLANYADLGGISERIREIILDVRERVDNAILRLIDRASGAIQRVLGMIRRGARTVSQWWRTRRSFTATDRTTHSLFFQGRGPGATLTVSTTPLPVNTFLRNIHAAATSSADPNVRTAYTDARRIATEINDVRARVENRINPRQPTDIDELNQKMTQMAALLPPLIPLLNPSGSVVASPSTVPIAVGELISVRSRNLIAVVVGSDNRLVRYKFIRPGVRRVTAEGVYTPNFIRDFGSEFTRYFDDLRELYLGPTPRKNSDVGTRVKNRMRREGKYRQSGSTEEILYSRDGQWWPLASCDMGHIIDAVTWWNSNGRLTGPQSSEALRFMNDSNNYEFEPSGPNRSRGARLGQRYLPPVI